MGFAGVNGAGKSTFLKCMLDFCHYESGDIRLFGVSSKNRLARRRMAFLPERFIPPYYLTGEQFLRLMMRMRDEPFSHDDASANAARIGLGPKRAQQAGALFFQGDDSKTGAGGVLFGKARLVFFGRADERA